MRCHFHLTQFAFSPCCQPLTGPLGQSCFSAIHQAFLNMNTSVLQVSPSESANLKVSIHTLVLRVKNLSFACSPIFSERLGMHSIYGKLLILNTCKSLSSPPPLANLKCWRVTGSRSSLQPVTNGRSVENTPASLRLCWDSSLKLVP